MTMASTMRPDLPDEMDAGLSLRDFRVIAALVHKEAGIHLSEAKRALVEGRLTKRLRLLGIDSFAAYRKLITSDSGAAERGHMLAALTTNVTRFNREPHHFKALREEVLPPLAARARAGGRVRLWSAACSTGEEPFSMALSLLAVLPEAPRLDVRVLATDINSEVVARGRKGLFGAAALAEVSVADRAHWFAADDGGAARAGPELSSLVAFRVLNLMGDWPMRGVFDVVLCRNVAIYFDTPTQERLWTRLARVIPAGGHLFIGHSERLSGPATRLFQAAGVTQYRRNDEAAT